MAENETLGASFSIDITSLKAGLNQANRLIRESESEFKAAASGMDDWTESQEGLQARIKHLNNAQDLQRKKVEALKKQYQQAGYASDDMSAAAVKLRTDINKEQAALNKTEKELKDQKKALEELKKSSSEASKQAKKLKDAIKKMGDGFTVAKGAIAGFIANGLTALVGSVKNAIGSILGLGEATREYREDIGKLETAFQTAGKSTGLAKDTYNEFYKVLGEEDRSVEAVSHLAKLVDTEEDMAKWTDIAAGVWGSFGDSLPIEGLTEAANETAKTGKLTGVLADALNWAGASEDDFKESLAKCNSESERSALITDTLNGLYKDASDKYKENNKSVMKAREAQSKYNDSLATVGEKIEPITNKIKEGFAQILDKILELTANVDMEKLGQQVDEAFDKFTNEILPAIKDGLTWIIDNKDYIIAGIAGIGSAFLAWKAVSAITAVTKAMKGMAIAQAALNLVMSLNPIGLIVAAIAGLIAIFVVLWNKCDAFREFWQGLWEGIKKATKTFVDWLPKAFSKAWESVKKAFSKVGDFFGNMWATVKKKFTDIGQKIGDAVGGAFKKAVNAVLKTVENVINTPIRAINTLLGVINKIPGIDIPTLKEFELPRLATGGVVNKATTAMIGEDGAEAVVPLEKNTGWIKKVADELKGNLPQQEQQPVVINQTNNYAQSHSRYELYKSKQATTQAVKLALGRI